MSEIIKIKKEQFIKDRESFEKEKESWEKLFTEEKAILEKEIELMQKYKKMRMEKNIKKNEEKKLSDIKNEYDMKDIQLEITNLKSLYDKKLSNLEYQKKLLEEEKAQFEKFKTDKSNNLEIKKMDLEQKKFELMKKSSEIEKRYNDIKYKEEYLKDKYDDYQRIKDFVEMKEKQNDQFEKDLIKTNKRIEKSMQEININENKIEKDKIDLLRIMHENQERKKVIENHLMDIEHRKAELNLRYKFLNTFSYKNPNENFFEKKQNYMTMPQGRLNENLNSIENKNEYDFNLNTFDYGKENGRTYNNNYEQFNADKYLKSVKNRIENGKRFFYEDYNPNDVKLDIANEKEYIRKNMVILNKNNKNY